MNHINDDRPVVVFGNKMSAELIAYCLKHDSNTAVAGFAVDRQQMNAERFGDLPLVAFEDIANCFPPSDFRMIIPIGFAEVNGVRRSRYEQAKKWGYTFASYISSRASIWPNLTVGENAIIYEHAIIQPFAQIGNNCIIRSGAHISHHCQIKDHVFVSAGVAMASACVVHDQAILGVGCVVRDAIAIGPRSFVGAGAVVVKDTLADGVYVGNPARKIEAATPTPKGEK